MIKRDTSIIAQTPKQNQMPVLLVMAMPSFLLGLLQVSFVKKKTVTPMQIISSTLQATKVTAMLRFSICLSSSISF